MAIPELVKRMAEAKLTVYCDKRVPPHVRDQVRLDFKMRRDRVDLYEERPLWNDPSRWTQRRIAQIRYDPKQAAWSLSCRDRHDKLHDYDIFPATPDFDEVLAEIDRDPTGIFWG